MSGFWGSEKAHLIHFINALLGYWFRVLQKLEERGDSWEDFPKLLPLAGPSEHAVYNREFASLVWSVIPTGCDYIPNRVLH